MNKPKLLVLVGPPGAGKSTFAKEYLSITTTLAPVEYINQDSQGKEKHLNIFYNAIKHLDNVVVDRMNFNKEQRQRYIKPAKEAGYEIEIVVLHENFETCFKRCMERNDHPTIKDEKGASSALNLFFSRYERPTEDEADIITFKYPDHTLKLNAVICDIDGTAANIDHRLSFVTDTAKKDWKNFFKNMDKDIPNAWCKNITNALRSNHIIVFCSGRSDDHREVTKNWLNNNKFFHDWLFMRNRQDYRQDNIVKENILDFELLTRFNISFVIDDRKQVVDMWRKRGVTCLQCANGEF